MTLRRFLVLLKGLSGDSLFRHAVKDRPVEIEGHAATSQAISRM